MQRLKKSVLSTIIALFLTSTTTVYSPMATHADLPTNTQKSVIFDLHGVLIRTAGEIQAVGLMNFLSYAFQTLPNPLKIQHIVKKIFFDFLHEIQPLDPSQPVALDPDGVPVPQIMCDWLKGTQSTTAILSKINAAAARYEQNAQLNLLLSICNMTFCPQQFITTQEWVPEGLQLAQELKERGYNIYILSNWDPESFELLEEYYPEILALFDGVVISGKAQSIKPDIAPGNIYEQLITKYNINPAYAVFIDDLAVNVKAAKEKYGIHGILCSQNRLYTKPWSKYPNISQVRREFNAWELSCLVRKPQRTALA